MPNFVVLMLEYSRGLPASEWKMARVAWQAGAGEGVFGEGRRGWENDNGGVAVLV